MEKSARDKRSLLVVLTDQGRDRYQRAFQLWQAAQDRYLSVVGEADAEHLRRRLLAIAHGEWEGVQGFDNPRARRCLVKGDRGGRRSIELRPDPQVVQSSGSAARRSGRFRHSSPVLKQTEKATEWVQCRRPAPMHRVRCPRILSQTDENGDTLKDTDGSRPDRKRPGWA